VDNKSELAELTTSRSRRGLFQWMKQVAAGIAVAGLGLGVSSPVYAQITEPDCYQWCPRNCHVTSCVLNGNCAHAGYGSYFI